MENKSKVNEPSKAVDKVYKNEEDKYIQFLCNQLKKSLSENPNVADMELFNNFLDEAVKIQKELKRKKELKAKEAAEKKKKEAEERLNTARYNAVNCFIDYLKECGYLKDSDKDYIPTLYKEMIDELRLMESLITTNKIMNRKNTITDTDKVKTTANNDIFSWMDYDKLSKFLFM